MNKNLRFLPLLLSIFCLTACDDDDDDDVDISTAPAITDTVTFEDADLGSTGYINSSSYVYDDLLTFVNNYDSSWGSFDGFVFSSLTDTTTIGYTNQFSVYDANGGATGSTNFAICYYSSYSGPAEILASETITPVSAYFCLTTYTLHALRDGEDGYYGETGKFSTGDYLSVTLSGYSDDILTGTVTFYPADYRSGAASLMTTWEEVDLTPLGSVDKITLTIDATKTDDYGVITPTYIALDNFALNR